MTPSQKPSPEEASITLHAQQGAVVPAPESVAIHNGAAVRITADGEAVLSIPEQTLAVLHPRPEAHISMAKNDSVVLHFGDPAGKSYAVFALTAADQLPQGGMTVPSDSTPMLHIVHFTNAPSPTAMSGPRIILND